MISCAQPNCFRKFSRLHSLKRHLVSHNPLFVTTKDLRLENVDNISEDENVIELQNFTVCTDIQVNNKQQDKMSKQHSLIFTQTDFITSVTNNALEFLNKLYGIDTMSRHHVQFIVENQMEMLHDGGYLDILESKNLTKS